MSEKDSEHKKQGLLSKVSKAFHRGSESGSSTPVGGIEYILSEPGGDQTLYIDHFGVPMHDARFYNHKGYRDIEFHGLLKTNKYLHFPNLEYRVVDKSLYLAFPRKFIDYAKKRGHWRKYAKDSQAAFHETPYDAYDPADTEWEVLDTPYLKLKGSEHWWVNNCNFLEVPSWITARPPKGSVSGKVDALVGFALAPQKSQIADPKPALFRIQELIGRDGGKPVWMDSGKITETFNKKYI
ncbi:hypothetical protein ACMFMG_006134 [Clarireedia jacksonii]